MRWPSRKGEGAVHTTIPFDQGVIAAARAGDVSRLVDLLRARRMLMPTTIII